VTAIALAIDTAEIFEPLLEPARYKGAKGGRGSGKSHFFAELLVEEHVANPDQRSVCIREVQKSLKFSAKSLIEGKIRKLGVGHLFQIVETEIRRVGGTGVILFVGMQDHTADSLKSLEGFDRAWVEEAQNLSANSLKLLRPTIRKPDSELWFSWNPDDETDPVDVLFEQERPAGAVCVHANYTDNPFCPETLRQEAREAQARDLDEYAHVWLGGYNKKSKAKIFADRCVVDDFTPGADWQGPYHGADFGFAADPSTLVRVWLFDGKLWIERESYEVGLEIDRTATRWKADVPDCERYVIRADSARPETISYLKRGGPKAVDPLPRIEGADKWSGSVEDGIEHLRGYRAIVIHRRCVNAQTEARLYSYKVDRHTGDILPIVVDAHNHVWDAVRYALAPLIKQRGAPRARSLT
jgi:phage terminase large subunit